MPAPSRTAGPAPAAPPISRATGLPAADDGEDQAAQERAGDDADGDLGDDHPGEPLAVHQPDTTVPAVTGTGADPATCGCRGRGVKESSWSGRWNARTWRAW